MAIVLAFAFVGAGTLAWTHAATTTSTLWSNNTVPKTLTDSDTQSVELGVKFKSKYSGNVTGVRFYKGPQNTGTHIGNLWSKNGIKLASVTFTQETASGWQQANFSKPVAIAANTTYVASYFAPNGRYSSNDNYFSKAYTSGPLTALRNGSQGGNGVYVYSSTSDFPLQTYHASNYWVDVVFTTSTFNPTVKPVAPSNLAAAVSGTTATLTWQNSPTTGLMRHDVYRDGKAVGASGVGKYVDQNLVPGTTYTYYVTAVESADNVSDPSNSIKVTVPKDTPPTTPTTPPTTPEPPTTPPTTTGFPSASNSGYKTAPGYTGSLTPFSGKLESGKTYRFMSFDSGFGVENVNDVTFYGCLFKGNDSAFANVIVRGSNNITFDYASFVPDPARYAAPPVSGQIPHNGSSQFGMWQHPDNPGKITIDHSEFWGFGNGIQFFSAQDASKPFTVRNSWFHDARNDGGGEDHTDGILHGGSDSAYVVIDHNTIVSDGNTNGLALQDKTVKNSQITNNYFSGFGYTVAVGTGNSNTNVTFTGNVFGTDIKPDWGPLYGWPSGSGNVWRNNKWHVVPGSYYTKSTDDGKYWWPDGTLSATDYSR
jgi:hypothetical protein